MVKGNTLSGQYGRTTLPYDVHAKLRNHLSIILTLKSGDLKDWLTSSVAPGMQKDIYL